MKKNIFTTIILIVIGLVLIVATTAIAGTVKVVKKIYAEPGDGSVSYSSNGAAWSTLHNATSGTSKNTTGNAFYAAYSSLESSPDHTIHRSSFSFNTNINASSTLLGAILKINVYAKFDDDNDGDDWITIVKGSSANLELSDFSTCGDAVTNPSEGSARVDIGSITAPGASGAYNNWVLNTKGLSWINKTGTTTLGLREGHDILNSSVNLGSRNGLYIYFSEQTGTSQDPYLEITYTCDSSVAPAASENVIITAVDGSTPPVVTPSCPFTTTIGSDVATADFTGSGGPEVATLGLVSGSITACVKNVTDGSFITSLTFFDSTWTPTPNVAIRTGSANGSLVIFVTAYNQSGTKKIIGKYLNGTEYCNRNLP